MIAPAEIAMITISFEISQNYVMEPAIKWFQHLHVLHNAFAYWPFQSSIVQHYYNVEFSSPLIPGPDDTDDRDLQKHSLHSAKMHLSIYVGSLSCS